MQHLDSNMDDLFQKAAESYPLKTELDDWDILAAKLATAPPVAGLKNKGGFRYRSLIIIALILGMILGGGYFYDSTIRKHTYIQKLLKKESNRKTTGRIGAKEPENIRQSAAGKHLPLQPAGKDREFVTMGASTANQKETVIRTIVRDKLNQVPGRVNNYHETNDILSVQTGQGNDIDGESIYSDESFMKASLVKRAITHYDDSIVAPALARSAIKVTGKTKSRQQAFHLGVNGGPEFSKVGSQSHTRTGYQAGILIGIKLTEKWSIESGLMIGKNNYYSNGSYFNMSKIAPSMPAGMEILALNSASKRLEIPVIAKYNFIQRREAKLFFTGGLLSDLYLQETNHYQTMLNGVKDSQVALYNQNSFMPAAQLRISIGYEHSLGRSGVVRVEPYKNIPLQKSGMGSMSVFSAGVNITAVRFFGR